VSQFFGSDFEVMNGHDIEKKEVNKRKRKNYSGGGQQSKCVVK
jgi:hypothetical protein